MALKLPPVVLALLEAAYATVEPARRASKAQKNGSVWLFGAHTCLVSQAHEAPRGGSKARGLVPVAYSPNDVVYFLDK